MKNKVLFERANRDNDTELKAKLRNDYAAWCTANGRTPIDSQSTIDWWDAEVNWNTERDLKGR